MTKIEYLLSVIERESHPAYIAQLNRLLGKTPKTVWPSYVCFKDSTGKTAYERIVEI